MPQFEVSFCLTLFACYGPILFCACQKFTFLHCKGGALQTATVFVSGFLRFFGCQLPLEGLEMSYLKAVCLSICRLLDSTLWQVFSLPHAVAASAADHQRLPWGLQNIEQNRLVRSSMPAAQGCCDFSSHSPPCTDNWMTKIHPAFQATRTASHLFRLLFLLSRCLAPGGCP